MFRHLDQALHKMTVNYKT